MAAQTGICGATEGVFRNTKSPERLFRAWGGYSRLENLNVFGLKALGALGHGEFNGLAFLEAPESTGRDRREMHENILAVLAADKAESLRIVKPLYWSLKEQ